MQCTCNLKLLLSLNKYTYHRPNEWLSYVVSFWPCLRVKWIRLSRYKHAVPFRSQKSAKKGNINGRWRVVGQAPNLRTIFSLLGVEYYYLTVLIRLWHITTEGHIYVKHSGNWRALLRHKNMQNFFTWSFYSNEVKIR